MAVSARILVEIFLMIFLSCVETFQRKTLHNNRAGISFLQVFECSLCSIEILVIEAVDAGAVLSAMICALTIQRSRVDDVEEELQQGFQ